MTFYQPTQDELPAFLAVMRDRVLWDVDELHRLLTVENYADPDVLRESNRQVARIKDRIKMMVLVQRPDLRGYDGQHPLTRYLEHPIMRHPAPRQREDGMR